MDALSPLYLSIRESEARLRRMDEAGARLRAAMRRSDEVNAAYYRRWGWT